MRVAFATCSFVPDGREDDHEAAALLGAVFETWDDPRVDWAAYDRVILRSVWDYTKRLPDFLRWCERVGAQRLRNPPDLVRFNTDKRYLGELSSPGVPTTFVSADDAVPTLSGEVVVKPNISAGARDTGRFGPGTHAEGVALIEQIQASGRVALVQPFLPAVDTVGETALVFLGGELSHVMRKRAVLAPDEVAPMVDGGLGVAQVMLEEDLVVPGTCSAAEEALARRVVTETTERFGLPLYVRVDLIAGLDGEPLLLELEAVEPQLFLLAAPQASARFAECVRAS